MNKQILITGLVSILLLAGCEGDVLELSPLSEANVEDFYKTPDHFVTAVNGVYDALRLGGTYGQYWVLTDNRSDDTWYGRPIDPSTYVDRFNVEPQSGYVGQVWDDHYDGIARANAVLDRLETAEFSSTLRDRLIGEAKFLRALLYFNLVRTYGDVPLVTKEIRSIQEGYEYLREPVAQVYEQIIADLQDAASKLPPSYDASNAGRATSGAANALLAKVYLTQQDYANARQKLEAVINSNVYSLWPDYADNFKPENANKGESIFEVQYKAGGIGQGSNWMWVFSPYNATEAVFGHGQGAGHNNPTENMVAAYEEGDLRKEVSFRWNEGDGEQEYYITKYHQSPFDEGDSDANWIVLRYADVLLMYAEVLNEMGETAQALQVLTPIRMRAGLDPLSGLDQSSAREVILHERRIELAFEGHRWWDLVRTGRAIQALQEAQDITVEQHELLFPIPQSEIDTNPELTQNPGY